MCAAWWTVGGASALLAQVAAGEVTGIVKDQAGAAVPGATVTVTEIRTNRQRIVTSSGDGVYTAPSLAPGGYRLDVELAGFRCAAKASVSRPVKMRESTS